MKKHIRSKPGMAIERGRGTVVEDFSTVTEKYRPQIFRFLLASLRDVDLAETLTQDCFLKAHLNWSNFRGEATARTWLMRIAINLQKDHWRNRRMRFWRHTRTNSVDLDDASGWLPSNDSSAEQRLIASEQVKEIWKVMGQLSKRQRILFILRFVEELTLCEIARATGLQEGTVKAHISRVVTKVRKALKQRQTSEATSRSHL